MQWNEYTGGALPPETTHVQTGSGDVIDVETFNKTGPHIVRYYGPVLVVGTPQPVDEPILPIPREMWADVVDECAECLVDGALVTVTHPEGYERCGLGIPAVRGKGNTHEYRPIVVLEWIDQQVKKT